MKTVLYIVIIFLGILLFKVGYVLLDKIKEDKIPLVTQINFWEQEIYIKDKNKSLGFTPNFLFKSIPSLDEYPDNKIIYFKEVSSNFKNNRAVITSLIIQENKVIYENSYYFTMGSRVTLDKIVSQDLVFDSLSTMTESDELYSIMNMYKGFIDLWLLYDLEQ